MDDIQEKKTLFAFQHKTARLNFTKEQKPDEYEEHIQQLDKCL